MKFTTNAIILFLALSLSSSDGKSLRGGHDNTESPTTSMYPSTAPSTSPITDTVTKPVPKLMSYKMANELLEAIPIVEESTDHNNRQLSSLDDIRFPAGDNDRLGNAFSIASGNFGYSPFKDIFPCDDTNGYDMTACIESVAPSESSTDLSRTIKDKESRKLYIESSVQAEGAAFGGQLSTSASFMTSSQMSTNSVSFMLSGTINKNITRIRNPSQLELIDSAKTMLVNHTISFLSTYGTNFISDIGTGGAFAGAFTLTAESSEQENDLQVQVDASYANDIFSTSGSSSFEEQSSSSSFHLAVDRSYNSLPEMSNSRSALSTPADLSSVNANWSAAAKSNPSPVYISINTYYVSNDVRDNVPKNYTDKFKGAAYSLEAIETATLEQLQTKLLIKSIQDLLNWPGMENQESTKIYKDLLKLKANATSYYTLYQSNFTDVSLYELQNQLINPQTATVSNKYKSWTYYSQSGGLADQFNNLNPKLEVSYVQNFNGTSGIQCCRDNYFSGLGNGKARTPFDCEAACSASEKCNYFDHADDYRNCVFCEVCEPVTKSKAKHYTSWAKQKKLVSSVQTLELIPPQNYELKYNGSMCCRAKPIYIDGGSYASSPYGCQEACDRNSECNFVDHSDKFHNCAFCNECIHTTGSNNRYYTSWEKKTKNN